MAELVSEDIVCPDGMPAFLARPAGTGPYPVLILMHERYGLVTHTKDLARRAAQDGMLALAPDFFFRHPDKMALNAGNSRYDLGDGEAVALLKTAVAALAHRPDADRGRVAVAGYCQTGRHPLVFASEVPISAAVVWYGAASSREWETTPLQPRPFDEVIRSVSCPVFAAFGAEDHLISVEDVRHFRNVLEAHWKTYEMHLYAGAPHGWLNDTMPGRYRKRQAEEGWTAQQHFLKRAFAGAFNNGIVRWRFESEFSANYDFSKNRRQA